MHHTFLQVSNDVSQNRLGLTCFPLVLLAQLGCSRAELKNTSKYEMVLLFT